MRSQEELKAEYDKNVKWFTDRVGKTIWRPDTHCCMACDNIYNHGLLVTDADHAHYVADYSMDGGIPYFDTKEERNDWERKTRV